MKCPALVLIVLLASAFSIAQTEGTVDGLVRVLSAPPINVFVRELSPAFGSYTTQVDVVPGHPVWIPDPTQPSGRALNPDAFTFPEGQVGNFPRNGLRSPYSIDQTDLALRRRFNLTERVNLDLRAEYFNVFNHPMFGTAGSQCNPDTPGQRFCYNLWQDLPWYVHDEH
jgi:hypothetical protein